MKDDMSDQDWTEAIDAVARNLIREALEKALDWENVGWEDYPDLIEVDWESVVARAEKICDGMKPSEEVLNNALLSLGGRGESADVG